VKRGDVVTVVVPGDYGKPRPAVIIQSDNIPAGESILVCLITSTRRDVPFYRLPVEPSPGNGLRDPSDVMADKVMAVMREKVGRVVGSLEAERLSKLTTMLAALIGAADDT
jgi:mRNA interferase MazF